jgi:hypothetical protein
MALIFLTSCTTSKLTKSFLAKGNFTIICVKVNKKVIPRTDSAFVTTLPVFLKHMYGPIKGYMMYEATYRHLYFSEFAFQHSKSFGMRDTCYRTYESPMKLIFYYKNMFEKLRIKRLVNSDDLYIFDQSFSPYFGDTTYFIANKYSKKITYSKGSLIKCESGKVFK